MGGHNLPLESAETINLTWNRGTQETVYLVLRYSEHLGLRFISDFLPVTQTSLSDNPPTPQPGNPGQADTAYCYMVLAFGGNPPTIEGLIPQLDPLEVTVERILVGLTGTGGITGRDGGVTSSRRFTGPESW